MKKWMWVCLGVLVIALVGAAGYYGFISSRPPDPAAEEEAPATVEVTTGDVQQAVSAPGQMIETKRESLRMGVEGQLAEVLVRPGDKVTQGQVLARMADKEAFEARVASAHLEVLQARQELDDLTASAPKAAADAQIALLEAEKKLEKAEAISESLKYPRAGQERLDSTYADYQKALEDVAMAQNTFDNVVTLPENDPRRVSAVMQLTSAQTRRDQTLGIYNWLSGKPTQADIDKAAAELKQAQAETDLARRALERVKGGPDSTQFELANAKIADLEAKYKQTQADLEHLELKAPFRRGRRRGQRECRRPGDRQRRGHGPDRPQRAGGRSDRGGRRLAAGQSRAGSLAVSGCQHERRFDGPRGTGGASALVRRPAGLPGVYHPRFPAGGHCPWHDGGRFDHNRSAQGCAGAAQGGGAGAGRRHGPG